MIGLMLAGVLSGLVSAGLVLMAGHSILMALCAYTLGCVLASVLVMTAMMVRMSSADDGLSGYGEAPPSADAKHT